MNTELATGMRLSPVLSRVEGPREGERPLLSLQSATKAQELPQGVAPLFPRVPPVLRVDDRPIVLDGEVATGQEKPLKAKGSWLSRFVSRFTDLQDEDHPNRTIEVVLPGKKR